MTDRVLRNASSTQVCLHPHNFLYSPNLFIISSTHPLIQQILQHICFLPRTKLLPLLPHIQYPDLGLLKRLTVDHMKHKDEKLKSCPHSLVFSTLPASGYSNGSLSRHDRQLTRFLDEALTRPD